MTRACWISYGDSAKILVDPMGILWMSRRILGEGVGNPIYSINDRTPIIQRPDNILEDLSGRLGDPVEIAVGPARIVVGPTRDPQSS